MTADKLGVQVGHAVILRNGASLARHQYGYIAKHPEHGEHIVSGKIRLYWLDSLGVYGLYGFPIEDAYEENGVLSQRFEFGTLRTDMPGIRDGIDLRGEIARRGIAVRDQGKRGTCSVQVMVFLLEYLYSGLLGGDYSHLSVEYSNHFGNVAFGERDDGHCFDRMEAAYNEYGIVSDNLWRYDKEWEYDYDRACTIATPEMIAEGRRLIDPNMKLRGRFVKPLDGTVGLTDELFAEMIALLDQGIPLGVGRDHSLTAVGYRLAPDLPGGGYMLFRNSYGTNLEFTGYQTETFELVKKTVNDVYVYYPNNYVDERKSAV